MTTVKKKFRNEPFDSMFRRFKKTCEKSDIISEVKRRKFYMKPSLVDKRAREIAVKTEQRRQGDQKLVKNPRR